MNKNNKTWIAALAGAGAGVIAGFLLAPNTGKDTRDNLKKSAKRVGGGLDDTLKAAKSKMDDMRSADVLNVKENWDSVKDTIKTKFDDLTD